MEAYLCTDIIQPKKTLLNDFVAPDSIKMLEDACLQKLNLLPCTPYPSKEMISAFRKGNDLSAEYRKPNPKDPFAHVEVSEKYSPPYPEILPILQEQFFRLLLEERSETPLQILRNAAVNYLLFFLIHPYDDGNKRTASYILGSRIGFPLVEKWKDFASSSKRIDYDHAHVGQSYFTWDSLIRTPDFLQSYFQNFYAFLLEAILN